MDIRLRNMTGIYLSRGEKLLLLYRQGGRVVSDVWVASAGGHFEKDELNDPRACVLRELKEELGLEETDLTDLRLRYIGLRLTKGEIRQNYYYFAGLRDGVSDEEESSEGKCRWIPKDEVLSCEMPLTAKAVMEHYLSVGIHTDCIYTAAAGINGYEFCALADR